ncbi:MAG: hypothetical protein JSR80_07070 [Verrucomicrobia bacterium]|nr:hypothetical protein [Verrucomicrobiota bacterium]
MSQINRQNSSCSSYLAIGGIAFLGGTTIALPIAAALGKINSGAALSGSAASFVATATSGALWALNRESVPLKNKKNYIKIDPKPPQIPPSTPTHQPKTELDKKMDNVEKKVLKSSPPPPQKMEKRILLKKELENRIQPSGYRVYLPLCKGEFCSENLQLAQEIKKEREKEWVIPTYCLKEPTNDDLKEIETVVEQGVPLELLELSNVREEISKERWEWLSHSPLVTMVVFKDEWLPKLVGNSLERGEESDGREWVHWGDRYEVEPGKFVKMPGFGSLLGL